METKKVAIAVAYGGAIGLATAIWLTPTIWFLGLFAGFTAGYLAYEFREVISAIPIAFMVSVASPAARKAAQKFAKWSGTAARWLVKPRPLVHTTMVVTLLLLLSLILASPSPEKEDLFKGDAGTLTVVWLLMLIIAIFLFSLAAILLIGIFWLGSRDQKDSVSAEEELSYSVFFWSSARGIGVVILFFVWTLWKYLAIVLGHLLWYGTPIFVKFTWQMYKLIHSHKRVLCGTDAAITVAVCYLAFAASATTFPQQITLVIFGALFGAGLGVIDHEIISKRLLKVAPVNVT